MTIAGRAFRCLFCSGQEFFDRQLQLNTAGMEFLGMGWANQSATGLVCADCGYVHMFLSDSIEFWEPDGGYPGGDH